MSAASTNARVLLKPGMVALLILFVLAFYLISSLAAGRSLANYITSGAPLDCAVDSMICFMRDEGTTYPFFYFLTSRAVLAVTGRDWTLLVLCNNTIYLLVLMLSVYLLGTEIKDRRTGLIAVLLTLLYPLTYFGFTTYCLDFGIMGAVAASLFLLLKSRFLEKTGWSIFFGLACGTGIMIKESFPAFMIGPSLLIIVHLVRSIGERRFRPVFNALLGLAAFLAVASLYYSASYNLFELIRRPLMERDASAAGTVFNRLASMTLYLYKMQLTLPFFLVLIAAVVPFTIRADRKASLLLFSAAGGSIAFFALMPHWMTYRYVLPLQPLYALVSAYALRPLVDRRTGVIMLVVLTLVGVGQLYLFTFSRRDSPGWQKSAISYFYSNDSLYPSLERRRPLARCLEGVTAGLAKEMPYLDRPRAAGEDHRLVVVSESYDVLLAGYWRFNGLHIAAITGPQFIDMIRKGDGQDASKVDGILYFVEKEKDAVHTGRRSEAGASEEPGYSLSRVFKEMVRSWHDRVAFAAINDGERAGDSLLRYDTILPENVRREFSKELTPCGLVYDKDEYRVYLWNSTRPGRTS